MGDLGGQCRRSPCRPGRVSRDSTTPFFSRVSRTPRPTPSRLAQRLLAQCRRQGWRRAPPAAWRSAVRPTSGVDIHHPDHVVLAGGSLAPSCRLPPRSERRAAGRIPGSRGNDSPAPWPGRRVLAGRRPSRTPSTALSSPTGTSTAAPPGSDPASLLSSSTTARTVRFPNGTVTMDPRLTEPARVSGTR